MRARSHPLLAAAAATLALSGCGGASAPDGGGAPATAEQPPAREQGHVMAAPHKTRTLVVRDGAATVDPSVPGSSELNAFLASGRIPRGRSRARVLTDENCEPDDQGISRCLNRLELSNGRRVSVRHVHRLSEVMCLVPGERIAIDRV